MPVLNVIAKEFEQTRPFAGLIEFDFHIELDAMGSRQEFIK